MNIHIIANIHAHFGIAVKGMTIPHAVFLIVLLLTAMLGEIISLTPMMY